MYTSGCEQNARMTARQFKSGLAAFLAAAGDHHLHDPGFVCAGKYLTEVFVERVVSEVAANINQFHLSTLVVAV